MSRLKRPRQKKPRAKGSDVVEGLSCFRAHANAGAACIKTDCRYWQKMKENKHHNCVILAAEDGPMTLQEVGDIFSVTRMRICQIEKLAKRFLKSSAPSVLSD